MRATLAFVVFLAGVSTAAAQADRIDGADITQCGIYEHKVTGTENASTTATGMVRNVTYRFVSETTSVPARRDVGFGFEYRIVGTPNGAKVPIRNVTIFPEGGVRNPKTGQTFLRSEYVSDRVIGEPILKGYTLDNDWEIVPGTWTFQVWFGDKMLAEKVFTLTRP